MDLESYNQAQGLEPLTNCFTKTAVGEPSALMSGNYFGADEIYRAMRGW